MNAFLNGIFTLIFCLPAIAVADKIYTCKEDVSSQVAFEDGEMKAAQKKAPTDPKSITFVVKNKGATVKNIVSEQYDLRELGPNVYYDTSHSHIVVWSVFPGSGPVPTYILYQTSLKTVGPLGLDYTYKCQ